MADKYTPAQLRARVDWGNVMDAIEAAKQMRSVSGGHLKRDSHTWHVAVALLRGAVIDDYRHDYGVFNDDGLRVNNIRNRANELSRDWGMPVRAETIEGKRYKCYYIDTSVGLPDEDDQCARVGDEPESQPTETVSPTKPVTEAFPVFDWNV